MLAHRVLRSGACGMGMRLTFAPVYRTPARETETR